MGFVEIILIKHLVLLLARGKVWLMLAIMIIKVKGLKAVTGTKVKEDRLVS